MMGLCLSVDDDDDKMAKYRSEEIERQLEHLYLQESNTVKILLLGAAESGKSTLLKQMRIIHQDGFTEGELLSFRPTILDNLLTSMKFVLSGMGMLRINLDNIKNRIHAQTVLSCQCCYDENGYMLPFLSHAINQLWKDKGVKSSANRGHEYELNDSALYYFNNMERICSSLYLPTARDVLRARVRTNGILETYFNINGIRFRMFDVGGQRSERKKWIQCFDDVNAIMFVAALSEYDMTLSEDQSENRIKESVKLFSQICNNRFFLSTSVVLFLNKLDLLREKILYSGRHLSHYFREYSGSKYDVEAAARFIQFKFQGSNKNANKLIYPHFTTATDTSNVQVVFQVAMDAIIRENLDKAYLL